MEPGGLYAEFCNPDESGPVTIYLGPSLPAGSSGLPEDGVGRPYVSSYLALLRVGFARRSHYCGRRCALTAPFHPYRTSGCPGARRYVSVALSVGLPRPGVTRHPARWSSDVPPSRRIGTAATQPPGSNEV